MGIMEIAFIVTILSMIAYIGLWIFEKLSNAGNAIDELLELHEELLQLKSTVKSQRLAYMLDTIERRLHATYMNCDHHINQAGMGALVAILGGGVSIFAWLYFLLN